MRATSLVRKVAVKADRIVDHVSLDHDERQKRRVALTGAGGLSFLVDLDKATVISDGDALKLEDGRLIEVKASPEKLLEIRAENPLRLMRVAWHIGNRHTPAEITADAIFIGHDHVLAEMVRGQGCIVSEVTRPFDPQRGAYDHGQAAHAHGDTRAHEHHDHKAHTHEARAHEAQANEVHDHKAHDHQHDDDCGCGHDHAHDHGHTHVHEHLEPVRAAHDHKHDHDHKHGHEHKHGH